MSLRGNVFQFIPITVLDAYVFSAHEISPMFSLLILYTGCLFADFVQWILKNASNGTHGCVRDFDVEASRTFAILFENPLA